MAVLLCGHWFICILIFKKDFIMARPRKELEDVSTKQVDVDDISKTLISDINKEFGVRMAYNLSETDAPTTVKQWISSRSLLLDYALANKRNGGYPGGRIIEIAGLPSTGKSHLAYEAARTVQENGGLVVYVDTENATPVEKLADMGIDVSKRFVYVDTHCTEEVFSVIDSIIRKSEALSKKGLPILVIWDSIAATSPKAELDGEYDANTMGLQARVMSKGLRKITGLIGQAGVTLMCINQLRMKINSTPYGDPYCVDPYTTKVKIRYKIDN